MFSQSEENYLKAIFHLQQESEKGVSTNELAESLDTKAASVTEMIKRLADKNLVDYQKYYGVHLTNSGELQALKVIRKHRLWETFLVDRLNFTWDEVHDVAEQLEHIQSQKLVEELERFLGFPKYDPHGDPIPDAQGNMPIVSTKRLIHLQIGDKGICKGFNDTSASFLQFLEKINIGLGTEIEVKHIENFDNSMTVILNNKEILLSKMAIDNIYVEEK